ncbi:MAG TPA: SDR family oxidoreductase [Stenomitos sp.]
MDLGLKGKRALVMGGSAGLGKAIARTLIAEGAAVAICARGAERLQAAAQELGATPLTCDLSEPGAGERVVQEAIQALGGVDILVSNTGGPPTGRFEDLAPEAWQTGFTGLFMSAVEAMRAALPGMRARGFGRLLLVTSVAAKEPLPDLTISNALRAGLLGLVNSVSREVAAAGITVNALMPGYTKTERLAELGSSDEQFTRQIPAGRLGRPEELGALTAFLASEWAGYVTGQAIACDGGFLRGI